MDLIDRIKELAAKIEQQKEHIETEEATKNAFIMPFISALGYDVFNPTEVIPEFTADLGTKKGEKVDYVIKKDGKIIMLMECKWCGADLHSDHASQLYRYFSVTETRFAILTNGIEYEFYSDIDEPNKMDAKPFLTFSFLGFQEHQVAELKKFTKSAFSLDDILASASTLKYANAIKKILDDEMANPSESFVRFFSSQIYNGRATKAVVEQFTQIVKDAMRQFINEKINERLKTALSAENSTPDAASAEIKKEDEADSKANDGIVTTEEEIEGFYAVKSILRETVDIARVVMRDSKRFCAVLLDDSNRKPICRLHFNGKQKYLGIIAAKQEERVPLDAVDDIYRYSDQIKATVLEYEQQNAKE